MNALWKTIGMVLFAGMLGACAPMYMRPASGAATAAPTYANEVMDWAQKTPGGQAYEVRRAQVWQNGQWVDSSTYWESGSHKGYRSPCWGGGCSGYYGYGNYGPRYAYPY